MSAPPAALSRMTKRSSPAGGMSQYSREPMTASGGASDRTAATKASRAAASPSASRSTPPDLLQTQPVRPCRVASR